MTLIQMKYFKAVCDYGGVTQAAAQLHISQPAISCAIKELEREFGIHLFVKVGKVLQVTKEGTMFRDLCEQMLTNADYMGRVMRDQTQHQKRVRLGITPGCSLFCMPPLYTKFSQEYPETTLLSEEAEIPVLLEKLDSKELDMVITRDLTGMTQKYKYVFFEESEWVVFVSPEHHLAHKTSVRLKEIMDEPWVGFPNEFHACSIHDALYEGMSLPTNVVFRSSQVATLMQMLYTNRVASYGLRHLSLFWPELHCISLDPPKYLKIGLYWRKDDYVFKGMQNLIDCVRKLELDLPITSSKTT